MTEDPRWPTALLLFVGEILPRQRAGLARLLTKYARFPDPGSRPSVGNPRSICLRERSLQGLEGRHIAEWGHPRKRGSSSGRHHGRTRPETLASVRRTPLHLRQIFTTETAVGMKHSLVATSSQLRRLLFWGRRTGRSAVRQSAVNMVTRSRLRNCARSFSLSHAKHNE